MSLMLLMLVAGAVGLALLVVVGGVFLLVFWTGGRDKPPEE